MTEVLIAIGFSVVVLFVVVPIITLFVFTLLDILWRVDIGFSKLVWALIVLGVPFLGLAMYWLLRPKLFDPWEETGEDLYTPIRLPERRAEYVPATATARAAVAQAPAAVAEPPSPSERPATAARQAPAERPAPAPRAAPARMTPALQGGADPEEDEEAGEAEARGEESEEETGEEKGA